MYVGIPNLFPTARLMEAMTVYWNIQSSAKASYGSALVIAWRRNKISRHRPAEFDMYKRRPQETTDNVLYCYAYFPAFQIRFSWW